MRDWLDSVAGAAYATALLWTFGALILLLVVLLAIKIVRNLTFGTFVAGGRHRKARLAVMDAAAVDSHRRLVLVRRDDVEHLLLIGGPSDVVVEQNIRLSPALRRPSEETPREHAAAIAEERPQPAAVAAPQPVAAPPPAAPVQQAPQQPTAAHPAPFQRPQPPAQPAPRPLAPAPAPLSHAPARPAFGAASPAHQTAAHAPAPAALHPAPSRPSAIPPAANAPRAPDLDDALRHELEVTLDKSARPDPKLPESVEDEMSRLLGDLTSTRR